MNEGSVQDGNQVIDMFEEWMAQKDDASWVWMKMNGNQGSFGVDQLHIWLHEIDEKYSKKYGIEPIAPIFAEYRHDGPFAAVKWDDLQLALDRLEELAEKQ